jgi:uncharacterized protein YjdB
VQFPITDSLGNQYVLDFPAVEVDGDLPSGGKRELVEVTLNYTVAKVAPTITRIPVSAITTVTVTPDSDALSVGETAQLAAAIAPGSASQSVTWSTSNASVATVSGSGLVTAVAVGSAVITATSVIDGTKKDTSDITVA